MSSHAPTGVFHRACKEDAPLFHQSPATSPPTDTFGLPPSFYPRYEEIPVLQIRLREDGVSVFFSEGALLLPPSPTLIFTARIEC